MRWDFWNNAKRNAARIEETRAMQARQIRKCKDLDAKLTDGQRQYAHDFMKSQGWTHPPVPPMVFIQAAEIAIMKVPA